MKRVLISAYACEPDRGSEPGAGFEWALAASRDHDVTVLTRRNNLGSLAPYARPNLRFVGVDLPAPFLRMKRRVGAQPYYVLWQAVAAVAAKRLHDTHRFDVIHHLTFANDWLPPGVFVVRGPRKVWGPIGGRAIWPTGGPRWLGIKGFSAEIARQMLTGGLRHSVGRLGTRLSDVVITQNPFVAEGLGRTKGDVVVHPNVVVPSIEVDAATMPMSPRPRTAVIVGRLDPLKSTSLAIAALSELKNQDPSWRLVIVGSGPDRSRLERAARKYRVQREVRFMGQLTRSEALAVVKQADVLVSTCMREAAGFAVAEAVALGVPIAFVDTAGPSVVARTGQSVPVKPAPQRSLPQRMAGAMVEAAQLPRVGSQAWSAARLPALLASIYVPEARGATADAHH